MSYILVTGSASGVGHAFVRVFSQKPNVSMIFALDQAFPPGQTALSLFGLEERSVRVELMTVDVAKEADVLQARDRIRSVLNSENVALNTIIHSAGIRGLVPDVAIRESSDVASAETLSSMTLETMQQTLKVNSVGTFAVLRAFVPLLTTSSAKPAKVVIMSSRMGSVGNNQIGGGYAYRASKAAQNAIVRSFSWDVPEVIWTMVHPGRVESRLVAVKEDGAMSPGESVADMMELLSNLGKEHSGKFIGRFGQPIPW